MHRIAVSFAVLVTACASGAGSGDNTSGSGARGALSVHIYDAPGQACPVVAYTANAPATSALAVMSATRVDDWVTDGQNGSVICSVIPEGGAFKLDAKLVAGPSAFRVQAVIAPGQSDATGSFAAADTDVTSDLESPAATPCAFSVAAAAGEQLSIADGRAWVRFTCVKLADPTDTSSSCSADAGYLALEGCSK